MKPVLYAHPFASYCWKVLVALYENHTAFTYRSLGAEEAEAAANELQALWPLKKFPVLVDAGRTLIESSIIIEHLGLHYPGPVRLVPTEPEAALAVRFLDRFFDNYIMTPMSRIVANQLRPEDRRDPYGVDEARTALDTTKHSRAAARPPGNPIAIERLPRDYRGGSIASTVGTFTPLIRNHSPRGTS